jgi:hypothetical protein
MSNFVAAAYNPKEQVIRSAMFMDDYFGHYKFGVMFEGDDKVYTIEEVDIPTDKVFWIKNSQTCYE